MKKNELNADLMAVNLSSLGARAACPPWLFLMVLLRKFENKRGGQAGDMSHHRSPRKELPDLENLGAWKKLRSNLSVASDQKIVGGGKKCLKDLFRRFCQ